MQTAMKPVLVGDEEGSASPRSPRLRRILIFLSKAGIHSDVDKRYSIEHHWVKLAVNAVINPLTVIFDCQQWRACSGTPEASCDNERDLHKEASALLKNIGSVLMREE